MARGSGTGTRGGNARAGSELTVARRAAVEAKSPLRGMGKLIRAYRTIEGPNGEYRGQEAVEPPEVLINMAGKPIEEAERLIANQDTEFAAVYDAEGNQIMVKTSSHPSYVDFTPKESKAMKGGTFTHNHPMGEGGEPIPFSRGDVSMLHQNKIKTFRARSGNTVFELSPPEDSKFWKLSPAKLKAALDTTFLGYKSMLGYKPNEPMKTATLAKVLDMTLTDLDETMKLGYKKKTYD